MALFGSDRDISLFRHVNRELMGNVISQQCVYYKHNLTQTETNIYGEATEGRFFYNPVLLYTLIERENQSYQESDLGINFAWNITFKFLRDDLVDANVVPEVGDIIMYQEGYYEVDSTNSNQFFVGKNPDYPFTDDNGNNPLNPGLEGFGYNVSIICSTHYVPADKLNITRERL